jgi:hypothetical protein
VLKIENTPVGANRQDFYATKHVRCNMRSGVLRAASTTAQGRLTCLPGWAKRANSGTSRQLALTHTSMASLVEPNLTLPRCVRTSVHRNRVSSFWALISNAGMMSATLSEIYVVCDWKMDGSYKQACQNPCCSKHHWVNAPASC